MEQRRKSLPDLWVLIAVFTLLALGILLMGYIFHGHPAELGGHERLAATLVVAMIVAAGAMVGLVWRHQRARFYRRLYEEEKWQNSLAERIEYLTRHANDIILLYDESLRIVEANERALEAYGYTGDEIGRIGLGDIRRDEALPEINEQMRAVRSQGGMVFESLHRRRDGSCFPVECSVRCLEMDGKPYYQAIIRDITERKRAEERIDLLKRLYEALSLSGQAIIRAGSREELLEAVCRIAVEKGGFRFAWVGLVDSASQLVLPAASCGFEEGYLERLIISVADIPEGRGPTGTAIREKRHVISADIVEDPAMLPWREEALRRGFRSSAAFPLIVGDEAVGALMVYAAAPEFFDAEITSLLATLSNDLSFALASMERDQALKTSRERLRLALRSSSMGAWEWDVKGNRNLWDESMYVLMGLDSGAPAGRVEDFLSFVHPGDRERVSGNIRSSLEAGGEFEDRIRIIRPDGGIRYLEVRGQVHRDEQGNPVRVAGISWDVTDRRVEALKLQRQKELLQTIVDAIPVIICYLDSDGSLRWANRGWEGVLGWSFTEHEASEILEKCYPDAEQCRCVQEFFSAAEGTWKDFVTAARDGTNKDIAWAAVRLSDDTVIAIGQDITEWKRVETEIRRLNAELEERVRARTAQLEEAGREMEAFSYSVSHDLRVPLRAIRGFAVMLMERHSSGLDAEGRRLLGVVIENTEKMGRLIDDLLAFSRVGRHEVTRTRIAMSAMVEEVIAELEDREGRENLEFRVEDLPDSWGDASMIRQVWVNLLTNAVKFTLPKGAGLIRAASFAAGGEDVYFVQDTGVGFENEHAAKLFGIFQRLHSSAEFEGTGVGLAIVERIVTRHGGRVWAEGKVGEGATFYFSLPRKTDVSRLNP